MLSRYQKNQSSTCLFSHVVKVPEKPEAKSQKPVAEDLIPATDCSRCFRSPGLHLMRREVAVDRGRDVQLKTKTRESGPLQSELHRRIEMSAIL